MLINPNNGGDEIHQLSDQLSDSIVALKIGE